jgi:hypothetical protein
MSTAWLEYTDDVIIIIKAARTREWISGHEHQNMRVTFFCNARFTETVLAGDENKQGYRLRLFVAFSGPSLF